MQHQKARLILNDDNFEITWNERNWGPRDKKSIKKSAAFKKHLFPPLKISAGLGFAEYTTNTDVSVKETERKR